MIGARAIMAMLARADSLELRRADSSDTKGASFQWNSNKAKSKRTQERIYHRIDLNRADSAQLLPLPGIGPVFAGRIVKYRELLGGYVNVKQLKEVYGMPAETVEKVRSQIIIDSSAIRKIRLDSATFGQLLRHPYLEYDQVKALVDYREFKGCISSLKELQINRILHDTCLSRLAGYFDF